MTEQELKWRDEFKNLIDAKGYSEKEYAYVSKLIPLWLDGFLIAKRSMPVVELPMICFAEMRVNEVESVLMLDDVKRSLDAAGIKYVIKG